MYVYVTKVDFSISPPHKLRSPSSGHMTGEYPSNERSEAVQPLVVEAWPRPPSGGTHPCEIPGLL